MAGKHVKQVEKLRKRDGKAKKDLSGEDAGKRFDTQAINHEHEKLVQWLKTVKFRKVLFGGVDETQLWKKLEELNRLYEAAISAERARYDALIQAYTESYDAEILKYKSMLMQQCRTQNSGTGGPVPRADRGEWENGN